MWHMSYVGQSFGSRVVGKHFIFVSVCVAAEEQDVRRDRQSPPTPALNREIWQHRPFSRRYIVLVCCFHINNIFAACCCPPQNIDFTVHSSHGGSNQARAWKRL